MKRAWLWLDVRRLAMLITFLAVFAMAARVPTDTDTWWHMQAGRVTWESGRIMRSDVFSHTRQGLDWINHSWLSQIMLYLLFRTFRYFGLGLFQALVVTAAFVFVYLQMEGDVFTRAFIVVLAAATGIMKSWNPAPSNRAELSPVRTVVVSCSKAFSQIDFATVN